MVEAVARAVGDVASSSGEKIAALCEVGGHPLASRYDGYLLQLDPALTVAEVVSRKPGSLQWLDDSVVLCEEADGGGQRVVRYWPESRRREVLIVPAPTRAHERTVTRSPSRRYPNGSRHQGERSGAGLDVGAPIRLGYERAFVPSLSADRSRCRMVALRATCLEELSLFPSPPGGRAAG